MKFLARKATLEGKTVVVFDTGAGPAQIPLENPESDKWPTDAPVTVTIELEKPSKSPVKDARVEARLHGPGKRRRK